MDSEITYQERIQALTNTKIEHNQAKLQQKGFHNIDDHGNIFWPDPIPFQVKPNH